MELCVRKKTPRKIKISASQLISNMICMNYDHNKKFGLLKSHSGYETFNLNSPKGYSLKIIYAQTEYAYIYLHTLQDMVFIICDIKFVHAFFT